MNFALFKTQSKNCAFVKKNMRFNFSEGGGGGSQSESTFL